ncbi:MAG: YbaN family protein [Anaerolineae bacterium]|nr:YbaN family protein [Anaerolineae bacterium]
MKETTRILLIALGTLFVALGILGMFLPVLPTTPFLLLAAICYGRSSRRFYHWLMTNRWCGAYIRNYREGRGIPLVEKVLTILLLWLTIGATAWLAVSLWWLRLLLLGIAVGVTIHLVKIKTYRPEPQHSQRIRECSSSEEMV